MLSHVSPQVHAVRVLAIFLATVLTTRGAPPERSLSTSRQFIVFGTEVTVRGAICELAERTKHDLLGLLGERDSWVTPIVINARYPQANVPEDPCLALNISQTGSGLKLQLDLTIHSEIKQSQLRRELLRALLLEFMYRRGTSIPAGAVYSSPPDWLLDGIPVREPEFGAGGTDVLAVLTARRTILPLREFLRQKPELLDTPAQSLYRAYSFALVELLARAPDGPGRLAQFVREIPSGSNDPMADLRIHFPELFEAEAEGEKLWENQVVRLSSSQPERFLSCAETERILDDKLQPLRERRPDKAILAALAQDLNALATHGHPAYRPIILDYARIIAVLRRGRTNGIAGRLERLAASRKAAAARWRGIDDYLNWFEATESRGSSGAFAEYLKAAESVGRPLRTRRDPISVYLDAIEMQFED
jgi:hypothetical protein